jgi:tRNA dimethylallyltransferase
MRRRDKALVVCGPTAAGKSELADALAGSLSRELGAWITTILVDSMQVYREIPRITNQARGRAAELAGMVSVAEEWTVARHKMRAEAIIGSLPEDLPFVLDAGTGMYLNALVLDVPLAPKVPREVRAEAEKLAVTAQNPRREARRLELELAGTSERGSIWDARPRYDLAFVYLRPPRQELDRNILTRSSKIVRDGAEEADLLVETDLVPNPSVRGAIGVKEMLLHNLGDLSAEEAEEAIATRTRRLARRQLRWFDKLARTLESHRHAYDNSAQVLVLDNSDQNSALHLMHDIIGE